MRTPDTLLRASLAAADPAADLVPASRQDLRSQALALLGTAAWARARTGSGVHRAGVGRQPALAACLVVVLGVAGVVALELGRPVGASDRAGVVLALAAGAITDEMPPGEYWWRVQGARVEANGQVVAGRVTYVRIDGSRPSIFDDRPSAGEVWSTGLADNDRPAGWQAPTPPFLAGLPRDVDALRSRLFADTVGRGTSRDGAVVTYVADLLRTGVVPPDLRRSLYAVLRSVPGVDVVGEDVSVAGRMGTLLGHMDGQQLLIDTDSGAMLAERYVPPGGAARAWTTVTVTVVPEVPAEVRAVLVTKNCWVMEGNGVACGPGGTRG